MVILLVEPLSFLPCSSTVTLYLCRTYCCKLLKPVSSSALLLFEALSALSAESLLQWFLNIWTGEKKCQTRLHKTDDTDESMLVLLTNSVIMSLTQSDHGGCYPFQWATSWSKLSQGTQLEWLRWAERFVGTQRKMLSRGVSMLHLAWWMYVKHPYGIIVTDCKHIQVLHSVPSPSTSIFSSCSNDHRSWSQLPTFPVTISKRKS